MFSELQQINDRPAVFSRMTVADLWTDPHVSAEMLRFHLDPSVDLSSRRGEFIDASVAWIVEGFGVGPGTRVLDLGCGPGLYTTRLAGAGADVTGVDFSSRSIAYAREAAARDGLGIEYVEADYLAWETATEFDLVTLIFCDLCPLAPEQRAALLSKVARLLAPGGSFLFDVCSTASFDAFEERASYAPAPAGGFWSPNPYFEFTNAFAYPDELVTLEKYVIVEADRTRAIYNWLQRFTPEALAAELEAAGLRVERLLGDVAGRPFDPAAPEFAVVARTCG